MEKQNLREQEPTFTYRLVASYNIRPGNGEGLFGFQRFINLSLTYLDTHLQPRDPHRAATTSTTVLWCW